MIIKAEDNTRASIRDVSGGKGELLRCAPIPRGEGQPGSPFLMVSRMTIQPGASLGFHAHTEDEEVYYVLSGEAEYVDHDGSATMIGPGDTTLCLKGQSHGVNNKSASEPFVFLAVIAKA